MDISTLESAIQHCEDVATQCENGDLIDLNLKECASEYRQLAEWLKELKVYFEKQEISTDIVNNHNCNDCIHNTICTWRGAKYCDWYVQDCNDAINRQDALDCLTATGLKKFDFILDARDKIKNLPSVTPQRTGRWIKYGIPRCGEQHYQCTSCEYYINFGQWGELYSKEFKYCPNCGAKMVVRE